MKKKNNQITELVFILDRSGSMAGLESDTIGGFNSMLNQQKDNKGKTYVTTILFDNVSEVLHDRILLEDIPQMTRKDYVVRGCTALLDAIGGAVNHIDNIHKYARKKDVPAHTMFIITTDGQENSSKVYNIDNVRKMIEKHKKKYGWEFLFIGANIDAVETASEFGIESNRAVNYCADSKGTQVLYQSLAAPISAMRANEEISDDWSMSISADFEERK